MKAVVLAKPAIDAKSRLAALLPAAARSALAAAMLGDLLDALSGSRAIRAIAVRTADRALGAMARRAGADWHLETNPAGLNQAAADALAHARRQHAGLLLVLPADLPLARPSDFDGLAAIAADTSLPVGVRARDGGTNALLIDTRLDWHFAFGPDSFAAHAREAARHGLTLRPVLAGGLVDDLDSPADIEFVRHRAPNTRTAALLAQHYNGPAPERVA